MPLGQETCLISLILEKIAWQVAPIVLQLTRIWHVPTFLTLLVSLYKKFKLKLFSDVVLFIWPVSNATITCSDLPFLIVNPDGRCDLTIALVWVIPTSSISYCVLLIISIRLSPWPIQLCLEEAIVTPNGIIIKPKNRFNSRVFMNLSPYTFM